MKQRIRLFQRCKILFKLELRKIDSNDIFCTFNYSHLLFSSYLALEIRENMKLLLRIHGFVNFTSFSCVGNVSF